MLSGSRPAHIPRHAIRIHNAKICACAVQRFPGRTGGSAANQQAGQATTNAIFNFDVQEVSEAISRSCDAAPPEF